MTAAVYHPKPRALTRAFAIPTIMEPFCSVRQKQHRLSGGPKTSGGVSAPPREDPAPTAAAAAVERELVESREDGMVP